MAPNSLLSGRSCPKCALKKRKTSQLLSEEEFLERLKKINPNVTPLEKYDGVHSKILCKCNAHNREWKTTPGELFKGHGCPDCYSERIRAALSLSTEEFIDKLKQVNQDIIVIGKYTNMTTGIKCKCKKCGHIWNPLPNNLLYGKVTGCPKCQTYSKGEDKIKNWFENNNIEFEIHKQYIGLTGVNGGNLSYDFYVPIINTLVEFQGEQHIKPITFGNMTTNEAEKQFKIQQEHDKRKREYANKNNIHLLEIWYFDFNNIEKILAKELDLRNKKEIA